MMYKIKKYNTIMSGLRRANREMEAIQLLGPTPETKPIWSKEFYDFQAKLPGPPLKKHLRPHLKMTFM